MRTEVQPKITNLTEILFKRKEKLAKVQSELEEESKLHAELEEINKLLEKDFKELTKEFDEISEQINSNERDTKELRHAIAKITLTIEDFKKDFRKNFIELTDDQIVAEEVKRIYCDDLKLKLNKTCKKSSQELMAVECVFDELKKEICKTARNVREAEMTKVKLQDDINHLMDKDSKEIFAYDYMGNTFIQYSKPMYVVNKN